MILICLFVNLGLAFTNADIYGYYRFDSATGNANNAMGTTYMNNLVYNGSVTGIVGRNEPYKRGLYSASNFFYSYNRSLWNTSQDYSVNLWFQFNSSYDNSYQTLASWGVHYGFGGDLLLFQGQLYCRIFGNNAWLGQSSSPIGGASAGIWHMASYVYNATIKTITCVIDNNNYGSTSHSTTAVAGIDLKIGTSTELADSAVIEYIEQILFFNKTLSSTEISYLYNSGNGINNITITLPTNGTTLNISGFVVSCNGLENGSNVSLSLKNGSLINSTTTNTAGNWSFFTNLGPGIYRLSASKNGSQYVPTSQLIIVTDKNIVNKKLSIALGYCPEFVPSQDFGKIFFDVVGGFFNGIASIGTTGFIIWAIVACLFLLLIGMLLGRRR